MGYNTSFVFSRSNSSYEMDLNSEQATWSHGPWGSNLYIICLHTAWFYEEMGMLSKSVLMEAKSKDMGREKFAYTGA